MSERLLLVTFEHEDDLLGAVRATRKAGLSIHDAYTPYAVHGLDRALGFPPSRLSWVCFVCGMFGAIAMLCFEHWAAAVNWAIDVGGKPWNSLPSDVPVAFEAAVLLAGFGSVFALFAVSRLYPGKEMEPIAAGITDDRFALLINDSNFGISQAGIKNLLKEFDVLSVEERVVDTEGEFS